MRVLEYDAPQVKVVQVEVEQGFAASADMPEAYTGIDSINI